MLGGKTDRSGAQGVMLVVFRGALEGGFRRTDLRDEDLFRSEGSKKNGERRLLVVHIQTKMSAGMVGLPFWRNNNVSAV